MNYEISKQTIQFKLLVCLFSKLYQTSDDAVSSKFQMAAVSVVPAILDYVCDDVIRNELLPRARNVYTSNGADVKIVLSLLACIAKVNCSVHYLFHLEFVYFGDSNLFWI
jgi:hypothetical protein